MREETTNGDKKTEYVIKLGCKQMNESHNMQQRQSEMTDRDNVYLC